MNISPRCFKGRSHSLSQLPYMAEDIRSGLHKKEKSASSIVRKARSAALKIFQRKKEISELTSQNSRGEETIEGTNHVFAISPNEEEPEGFLKVGPASILEQLMWISSIILGVNDFFTATTEFKVSPRKAEKLTVLASDKRRYSMGAITLPGSFQATEKGLSLSEVLDNEYALSDLIPEKKTGMEMLDKAVLVSLVFGMSDAHSDNIKFNQEQAIFKFFDNTRCFPHGIDMILHGANPLPSYRCGLLELDECYQTLTEDQKKSLLEEFNKVKEAFPQWEKYIMRPDTQDKIKKLPFGWFNTQDVIAAARERMTRIERALCDPNVNTLEDLVCSVFPYHRFFAILSLATYYLNPEKKNRAYFENEDDYQEVWKTCLTGVGAFHIPTCLKKCYELGLDVKMLYNLSKEKMGPKALIQFVNHLLNDGEIDGTEEGLYKMMNTLFDRGRIDLKDISQDETSFAISQFVKKVFWVERERAREQTWSNELCQVYSRFTSNY